jgi:hypothetical protein
MICNVRLRGFAVLDRYKSMVISNIMQVHAKIAIKFARGLDRFAKINKENNKNNTGLKRNIFCFYSVIIFFNFNMDCVFS